MVGNENQIDSIIKSQQSNFESKLEKTPYGEKVFRVLFGLAATILVFGVLGGIIVIAALKDPSSISTYSPDPHPLRFFYGIIIIISSGLTSALLYAFSAIIDLLINIEKNTSKNR